MMGIGKEGVGYHGKKSERMEVSIPKFLDPADRSKT